MFSHLLSFFHTTVWYNKLGEVDWKLTSSPLIILNRALVCKNNHTILHFIFLIKNQKSNNNKILITNNLNSRPMFLKEIKKLWICWCHKWGNSAAFMLYDTDSPNFSGEKSGTRSVSNINKCCEAYETCQLERKVEEKLGKLLRAKLRHLGPIRMHILGRVKPGEIFMMCPMLLQHKEEFKWNRKINLWGAPSYHVVRWEIMPVVPAINTIKRRSKGKAGMMDG